MTFLELRNEVRRRLRETTDSPTMWSDADIDGALNEGLAELADQTEFHEKWQYVEILYDRPYYDMRTIARDSFLVCGAAFNSTTNRWMIPTSSHDMDQGNFRWEERGAEPERFLVRGLWWVGYWPVKHVQDGEIKQYYIGIPDPMSADSDAPPLHTAHHYALVEYALADLFAQDSETDLAWASWKEYLEYEARVGAWMQSRAAVPSHHGMRPTEYGV